ncbi:hypothetical protein DYY67_0384 [Candidatus Nitrosotalea sp. TS]|uniref:hypothetical protein n=1 Tax=Candidatus Nitrosotalea sp. TS TaxID=2341020 RepID=UPI001407E984|nr:hypothetical protein [Candidatus Nitrosotalea sp. TS]NHI02687.1 hypothetical protein [Candidatus Nitrosotalea sp. TS]
MSYQSTVGSVEMDTEGNIHNMLQLVAMDLDKITGKGTKLAICRWLICKSDLIAAAVIVGDTVANPPGATTPFVTLGQTVKLTYTYADPTGKQEQEVKNFIVRAIVKPTGDTYTDNSNFHQP